MPNLRVYHLHKLKSDHRPLAISFDQHRHSVIQRPFRFLSCWLSHGDFGRLVAEKWCGGENLESSVSSFLKDVQLWNKEVFGNVQRKKRSLIARIGGIQRSLEKFRTQNMVDLERKLQIELEGVLDNEELIWKQKSRSDWLSYGDHNTNYFHSFANCRRKVNHIYSLKLDDGQWCHDEERIKNVMVEFYRHLYTDEGPSVGPYPIRGDFPSIDFDLMASLGREVSMLKVRTTLFEMAPLKSPGIDGLHAQFYQSQWEVVGDSLLAMIRKVFEGGLLESFFNKTLIVLIPKVSAPETVTQFHPISLCTVPYKLLTKVIINRLKPVMPMLVAQNQTSFVGGRNIMDNVVVAQEVVHSMRIRKGKKGLMDIKIDMEKAYDRLVGFHSRLTHDAKLPDNLIHVIMHCVSLSSLHVCGMVAILKTFNPQAALDKVILSRPICLC